MIAAATALALGGVGGGKPERSGVYHLTARGETTWHGFASAIHAALGGERCATRRVTPIRTDEYPTAATRPAYSVLGTGKLERDFGLVLPPWDESLARVMEELASGGAHA
jgi:dTDP-4-dehydrorhamnose reductase